MSIELKNTLMRRARLFALLLAVLAAPAAAQEDVFQLVSSGQYEKAVALVKAKVASEPWNADHRVQLAEIYLLLQDLDNSFAVLTEAAKLDPDNPTVHTDLGIVHELQGHPSLAVLEQIRAAELSSEHPTAFNNLGHTWLSLGVKRKAHESFRRSVLVNMNALLKLKTRLGLGAEASGAAPALSGSQKSALTFHIENIAYAYLGMDNLPKAIEAVREALEYDPENAALKERLFRMEEDGNELTASLKPVELTDAEAAEREGAARKLLLTGSFDDAGALVDSLLRGGVDSASLRAAYGIVLQAMGDVEGAVEQYQAALRLDPLYATAMVNLGFLSEYQGLFDESIKYYSDALKINSDNSMVHNNLGHVYELFGDPDKALESYLRALEIDPENSVAMQNIAGLYLSRGMLEQATDALNSALAMGPASPAIYNNLAFILYKQMKITDARNKIEEGLKLTPRHKILERNLDFLLAEPVAEYARTAPGEQPPGRLLSSEQFDELIAAEKDKPPAAAKPPEKKPAPKTAESKPVAAKPVAKEKPTETKQTPAAKPAEKKPEQKPAAAKKPDAAKPKPAEKKPAAAKPSLIPPAEKPPLKPARPAAGLSGVDDAPIGLELPLPAVGSENMRDYEELLNPFAASAQYPQGWKEKRKAFSGKFVFESRSGDIVAVEPSTGKTLIAARGKQPAAAADGTRIVFVERVNRDFALLAVPGAGGKTGAVFSSRDFKKHPAFSSDGKTLAFLSSSGNIVGSRLWTAPAGGGEARQVKGLGETVTYAWAPRSRSILALTTECPENQADRMSNCLAKVDVDTGKIEWLTLNLRDASGYEANIGDMRIGAIDVSPSSGELLVATANDPENFLVCNLSDGAYRTISPKNPAGEAIASDHPAWSPDGAMIAFLHRGDIWVVPAAGGEAWPAVTGYMISGRITWVRK